MCRLATWLLHEFVPSGQSFMTTGNTGSVVKGQMMTTTKTRPSHEKLSEVHERLVQQLEDLRTSEDWVAFLRFAAKFHSYSARNTLLILNQRPSATRVASFTAWRSMGRQVRKGEKGIKILAPCRYRTSDADNANGSGEAEYEVRGFRVVHVFDQSQLERSPDGSPEAPAQPILLEGTAPTGMWEAITTLIERDGFTVERADCGEANGYTSRLEHKVVVAPHLSDAAATKTAVHELAHVRQIDGYSKTASRDLLEISAESCAMLVSEALGMNTEQYSVPYVLHWAGGDLQLVQDTASWVVSTSHRIIDECRDLMEAATSAA